MLNDSRAHRGPNQEWKNEPACSRSTEEYAGCLFSGVVPRGNHQTLGESGTYYRRHLPHVQPEGGTFHVCFRLVGSIPTSVLEEYRILRRNEKKRGCGVTTKPGLKPLRLQSAQYVEKLERMVDSGIRGPQWLDRPEVAAIVDEAIWYRDRKV